MSNPFIAGANIFLRPLEKTDLPLCLAWINDPEVNRYLYAGRMSFNMLKEEEWFENASRSPNDLILAICVKDGGRHIGTCGLHKIDFQDSFAHFGILIGEKDYWGKGFGGEAVELMLAHAFNVMGLHRVELEAIEYNERAMRCYKRCGFVEEGRLKKKRFKEGAYRDEALFAVLREEWEARRKPA